MNFCLDGGNLRLGGSPIKTLAIRQPWISLIAEGDKTIEVRSWPTTHRGPLLLAASGKDLKVDCDGEIYTLPAGIQVCIVDLVDFVGHCAKPIWLPPVWTMCPGSISLASGLGASPTCARWGLPRTRGACVSTKPRITKSFYCRPNSAVRMAGRKRIKVGAGGATNQASAASAVATVSILMAQPGSTIQLTSFGRVPIRI